MKTKEINGGRKTLRIAKTVEEDGITIRPVVVVTTKISGEKKDIEMIITNDTTYP
jgi:hypothetical protein